MDFVFVSVYNFQYLLLPLKNSELLKYLNKGIGRFLKFTLNYSLVIFQFLLSNSVSKWYFQSL